MIEKGGKCEELDDIIEHRTDFTYTEEIKSIKDSFQNEVNNVELEDDILTKISKSDKESKDAAESY